jgi:hypothetical protein
VKTALSLLALVCFAQTVVYVLWSLRSALWAARRHGGNYFHLEFAPHRARGKREAERAKTLRRMRTLACVVLPVGLAAKIWALMI